MSAAPVEEVEVGDLDPAGVLAMAEANEREIRERELLRLELAYQWAVLHPASGETGVETPGGPALGVLTAEEALGGEGTPAVAAFTPEAFAAALGMSPGAGAALIGDALDLRHRLPLLVQRVQALLVPAWQARRVAQQTHRLPRDGARWVDEQLAARTDGGCGPVITDRLVAHAIAKFDPEAHERREDRGKGSWDAQINHPDAADFEGTSDLQVRGDTLTLKGFHDLLGVIAHQLRADGDTDPLGVRKIKAVGIITALVAGLVSGQTALDLDPAFGTALRKQAGKVKAYVHVDADDLDVDAEGGSAFATGTIEKLGAATMARLREWVGHHQVVIQPVLNMARRDAVDQHDPPEWMAELVELRDGHCVFPRCTVDAKSCDKDHIVAYVPLEEGGPPGQTRPDNLACLCRRHHRAKTARLWRYTRTPEGHYLWHGPYGATYLVTPDGTQDLRRC